MVQIETKVVPSVGKQKKNKKLEPKRTQHRNPSDATSKKRKTKRHKARLWCIEIKYIYNLCFKIMPKNIKTEKLF